MINLIDYGWDESIQQSSAQGIPARITAVHRERYELACQHGIVHGRLKTAAYYRNTVQEYPTVGDFVVVRYVADGDSQIVQTLPRKSYFSRRDGSGHVDGYVKNYMEHIVAANFDYVFIMQSLNHDFNEGRLHRYVTQAYQSGATPIIVLTKADLVEKTEKYVRAAGDIAIGVDIIAVSSVTGAGLDSIRAYLSRGKTAVFLGSSGVGKSSLVNALFGEDLMKVNAIREDDSKGRHTTTHRQLFMLPNGGMVIDTPGMRELGMWDVTVGLGETFTDVEEVLARGCKYSNCRHQSEPGCAVKAAIEQGELSPDRWEAYNNLKHEAKYTDNKATYLRGKRERQMQIAIQNKQNKKKGDKNER